MASLDFQNIHSERDLTIIVRQVLDSGGNLNETEISEVIRQAIKQTLAEELGNKASRLAGTLMEPGNQVMGEIFYKNSDIQKSIEASAKAVWDAALGDELATTETSLHREAIARFIAERPGFVQNTIYEGRGLTLSDLPKAFAAEAERTTNLEDKQLVLYLQGASLFLGCQYGNALKILQPLTRVGAYNPDIETLCAEAALNVGQFSVALSGFQKILTYNSTDHYFSDFNVALIQSNVGACHEELLESEEAIECYQVALSHLHSCDPSRLVTLAKALIFNNLGFSLMTLGGESESDHHLITAASNFKKALELREISDDTPVNKATVLLNLAEVCQKLGDSGEASFLIDKAEGTLSQMKGKHILYANILNTKGKAFFDRQEYDSALRNFREARTILSAHYGDRSVKCVLTTFSIANTLEAMGDPDAQSHLLHARKLAIEVLDDPSHPIINMIDHDLNNPLPKQHSRGWFTKS